MTYSKQMWTFIVPEPSASYVVGEVMHLPPDEHHFAFNVLRLHVGEEVWLTNCEGVKARGKIVSLDKKSGRVVLDEIFSFRRARPTVELYVGLTKLTTLEQIVSDASEMGVDAIHIIKTQKCAHRGHVKLDKYQKLSQEAVRISKIPFCAKLFYYEEFQSFMAHYGSLNSKERLFFCDEELSRVENSQDPHSVGRSLHLLEVLQKNPPLFDEKISIFIGPEASFSKEERDAICAIPHMVPVSLGPHILRVPTAVCASLGVIFGACSREAWYVQQ